MKLRLCDASSGSVRSRYLTATARMSLSTLSPASHPGLTVKSRTVMADGSGRSSWCLRRTAWSHSSVTGQSAPLLLSSSLSDIVGDLEGARLHHVLCMYRATVLGALTTAGVARLRRRDGTDSVGQWRLV